MGTPQNGFAREALENERRSRQAKNPFKPERKAIDPGEVRRRLACEANIRVKAFNRLQVGDSLRGFGFPEVVVAKKNRKSVISTMGNKYMRKELTGE